MDDTGWIAIGNNSTKREGIATQSVFQKTNKKPPPRRDVIHQGQLGMGMHILFVKEKKTIKKMFLVNKHGSSQNK